MRFFTRPALVRYFFPFDAEGRLDILGWWFHRYAYLRRNLLACIVLLCLQEPLVGMPLTSTTMPHTVWQILYLALFIPFGTVATASAVMILDDKGPKH
jgi:hypothetical protein